MNEKISGLLDPKMWEMSEEAKALARQHLQNEEERLRERKKKNKNKANDYEQEITQPHETKE